MLQSMIEATLDATRPDDTPSRIVDAAERLFIRDGTEATSLRAVTREAGVNVAAIHYYFGSRDELLRAVLDRIIRPLNQRRLAMLDQYVDARHGRPLAVEEILRAFFLPQLEMIEMLRDRGVEIAHFAARSYAAPSASLKPLIEEQFGEWSTRFMTELARALPAIDREELAFRFRCVVGVVVRLLGAATPRGVQGGLDTAEIGPTLERLVAFIAPGLCAPAPALSTAAKSGRELPRSESDVRLHRKR
jgi:AcrR family transcriptional regulator